MGLLFLFYFIKEKKILIMLSMERIAIYPNGLNCVTCCPWRFKLKTLTYAKILTMFTTLDYPLWFTSLFVEVF